MSGQIITFYSYKGGTGRTMALANVATLLSESYKVLVIDWDLEAPGLHYFFKKNDASNFSEKPGLIDIFKELKTLLDQKPNWVSDQFEHDLFNSIDLDKYLYTIKEKNLFLLAAGKLDDDYPRQVATFQWEALFYRAPWLFRSFARYLANQYDFVLIDSRTGLNDISGICTALMPDKLVAVFTPSLQSITGIINAIKNALHYRIESDDLRLLNVFPVPSRIELQEKVLLDEWRFGTIDRKGYQHLFEELFRHSYNLEACDLNYYFDNIQIQQFAYYAYGENIAVAESQGTGRLSLSESYSLLTTTITNSIAPWNKQDTQFESSPDVITQNYSVNTGKVSGKRKLQLDAVLIQLTSQRPSDVWRGMEQIRQWLKIDKEDREVYGVLLDAVQKNPEIRENVRNIFIEMIQLKSVVAEEALTRLPTFIPDVLAEADDAYYAAEYSRAIQLYQQVLRLDPTNTNAKEHLEKALLKQENSEQPTDLPRSAKQYYWRARSYIAGKETITAINLLNAAIEAAQAKGMSYPEAEETLVNIQKLSLAEEHIKKAESEIKNGRRKEALADYRIAQNLDPSNSHIRRRIREQHLIINAWWIISSFVFVVALILYGYNNLQLSISPTATQTVAISLPANNLTPTIPITATSTSTPIQTYTPTPTETISPTPTEKILGTGYINKAVVSAWLQPNSNKIATLGLNQPLLLLELASVSGSNWFKCRWEQEGSTLEGWILAEYIFLGPPPTPN